MDTGKKREKKSIYPIPLKEWGQAQKSEIELSGKIRGPLLDQAILIELLVQDTIRSHFCQDTRKWALLDDLILNQLSFDRKIWILDKLLKLNYEDLDSDFPMLNRHLESIKNYRNKIAHSLLDTDPEWLLSEKKKTDRIRLKRSKNGKPFDEVLTVEDRDKLLKKWSKIILPLLIVRDEVSKRSMEESRNTLGWLKGIYGKDKPLIPPHLSRRVLEHGCYHTRW